MGIGASFNAFGERITNSITIWNKPRRVMRLYARRWLDKVEALSKGNLYKAGFDKQLKEIETAITRGDKELLLNAFANLKNGISNLDNKILEAQEKEILAVDQYLAEFKEAIKPITDELKKHKVSKETETEINKIIHEIYQYFYEVLDYIVKFEKKVAFERTTMQDIRFTTDNREFREMGFTYAWQDDLEKDENKLLKNSIKLLNHNEEKKLIEDFKKLKDDYKKEKEIEKSYMLDLLTRIEKIMVAISSIERAYVERLRKTGLDLDTLTKLQSEFMPLLRQIKKKAEVDWELAKSALAKVRT